MLEAGGETSQFIEQEPVPSLHFFPQPGVLRIVRRSPVDGEDIHLHADFPPMVRQIHLLQQGPFQAYIGIRGIISRVQFGGENHQVRVFPIEGMDEPLVIGSGHPEVDVLVPGNVSLVPDGPDQAAISEKIPDAVPGAEVVDFYGDAGLETLQLFNGYLFHFSSMFRNSSAHQSCHFWFPVRVSMGISLRNSGRVGPVQSLKTVSTGRGIGILKGISRSGYFMA